MTDRGAIESIAKALHDEHLDWCEVEYGDFLAEGKWLLDALAADGYTVVKTKWEYAIYDKSDDSHLIFSSLACAKKWLADTAAMHPACCERRIQRHRYIRGSDVTDWEPVPEGSEDEQ